MIVLNTNVISELMRPQPAQEVVHWLRSHTGHKLYTTAITLAEVRYGIERLPEGRRKRLVQTTSEQAFASFQEQILPFDATSAAHYARIVNAREQIGAPIDGFDAQIAAICRTHRTPLATRNLKDFVDTGVDLIDPWAH